MREIDRKAQAIVASIHDDYMNDIMALVDSLPKDKRDRYDEECDIAIPLFDAGARGEELYRLIDEELERRSLAGANV